MSGDDLALCFGDYEFKRLKNKTGMQVDVEQTPVRNCLGEATKGWRKP